MSDEITEPMSLWREEFRDPRTLMAHPRNPRTHPQDQIDQVRKSIREFGFTNPPLIVPDGRIIAGHCRTECAILEHLPLIPVRVRVAEHPLTETQELALLIADNKIALNAGWDTGMLRESLKELDEFKFDLDVLGFTDAELSVLSFIQPGTTNPMEHWQGMPEYSSQNMNAFRTILVHFVDQQGVDDFAVRMGQSLTEKTKYVWHPAQEDLVQRHQEYVSATE